MTYPLVSVIVPCYNVEQYLPQCIDSILNQTYKNLEVWLIDDGSPDNCGAIQLEWQGDKDTAHRSYRLQARRYYHNICYNKQNYDILSPNAIL